MERRSMIVVDYKDTRPIYEQIVERFQNLILTGVLAVDEQLPSVRSLAMELSINPNTIQKAYSELERRGFIYTVKGKGNFVTYKEELMEYKKKELKKKLDDVVEEAEEVGITKTTIIYYLQNGGASL